MTRTLLQALVLLACACTSAAAQDAPPARDLRGLGVSEGSRVRVTAPAVSGRPMVGRVAGLTADSLALTRGDGATLQIDARQVQAVSVSAGRSRWKWALGGAAAGFLAGGVLGGAAGGHDDQTGGLGAMAGFVAGVVVGTPLGAGIGAALAPERWTPVRLPPPAS